MWQLDLLRHKSFIRKERIRNEPEKEDDTGRQWSSRAMVTLALLAAALLSLAVPFTLNVPKDLFYLRTRFGQRQEEYSQDSSSEELDEHEKYSQDDCDTFTWRYHERCSSIEPDESSNKDYNALRKELPGHTAYFGWV